MSGSMALGLGLMVAGLLWLGGVVAFFAAGVPAGKTDLPAAILGSVVFGLPPALVLAIGGVMVFLRGRREAREMAAAHFQQRVLDMIETRGTVYLREMAEDLGCTVAQVEEALHELVGKRLFEGFINWRDGRVYSRAAGSIASDKCPNCGGKVDLAGKDLAACPYCGTEFFLPRE